MPEKQPLITSAEITAEYDARRLSIKIAAADLDLSRYAWRVLEILRTAKGAELANATLAAKSDLNAPRTSEAVKQLLSKEFIQTRSAPEDRRRLLLRITAKGIEACSYVRRATGNAKSALQASALWQALSDELSSQPDINLCDFRILLFINESQHANVSECSRNLHIPQATVSKALAHLNNRELIAGFDGSADGFVAGSSQDRRAHYWQLSSTGTELLASVLAALNASLL